MGTDTRGARLVPIVASRLYFLSPSVAAGSTYAATVSYILAEAAMQYSLMSECMTCLKPYLKPFHSGYGTSQSGSHNAECRLSLPRERYLELSQISHVRDAEPKRIDSVGYGEAALLNEKRCRSREPSQRPSIRRVLTREDFNECHGLRRDVTAFSSHVEADVGSKRSNGDDDEMVIQQTVTVSVFEDWNDD